MFKVGDRVHYVGEATHNDYANLGAGTVRKVVGLDNKYVLWPFEVRFDNYPHYVNWNDTHPCGFDELERIQ